MLGQACWQVLQGVTTSGFVPGASTLGSIAESTLPEVA